MYSFGAPTFQPEKFHHESLRHRSSITYFINHHLFISASSHSLGDWSFLYLSQSKPPISQFCFLANFRKPVRLNQCLAAFLVLLLRLLLRCVGVLGLEMCLDLVCAVVCERECDVPEELGESVACPRGCFEVVAPLFGCPFARLVFGDRAHVCEVFLVSDEEQKRFLGICALERSDPVVEVEEARAIRDVKDNKRRSRRSEVDRAQ
jgi:hypothetical protein